MVLRLYFVLYSLLFIYPSFLAVGQNIQVIDVENLQGIPDVLVYNNPKNISVQTDLRGYADIGIFQKGDTLNFQHPAYYNHVIVRNTLNRNNLKIGLREKIINMDEVVVSANKWEQKKSEVPNEIMSIDSKSISFQNSQTSADVLEQSGQVFVQKSQLGGGSPKIRGFSANSILIVVDGVRMNNAIYRSGNLQNVISIDPNALKNAEVVFGPGSVTYGSDALGGVMDFHTKSARYNATGGLLTKGSGVVRYSSANQEKTGHFDISLSGKKFSTFHSFSYSDFDDLRTGSNRPEKYPEFGKRNTYVARVGDEDILLVNPDPDLQVPSGFEQWSSIHKFKYKVSDNLDLGYGLYFSNSSNIPRYDRLIEIKNDGSPANAEWFYGRQRWLMHHLRAELFAKNTLWDEAKLILAYQEVEESRNDRKFGDNQLRTRTEEVDVYSLNLEFDKSAKKGDLSYGIESVYNTVTSSGFRRDILTDVKTPTTPRYPEGGSDYLSLATYAHRKYKVSEKWLVSAGLRYNFVKLTADVAENSSLGFEFDGFDLSNGAFNGSVGAVYGYEHRNNFSLLLSSGFRSPNIDDVGKVFDFTDGNVQVPNENLRPEYVYTLETGGTLFFGNSLKMEGVLFYSLVDNAMVRRDFQFKGQDSIVFDGALHKVQALVNTGRAFIYGGNLQLIVDLRRNLILKSSINYTYGKDKVNNEPLRHTTPVFGRTSLSYTLKKFRYDMYFVYNGNRLSDDIPSIEIIDKPHLYTSDGSPGWYTANSKFSYQINPVLQVSGGIENIFDRHYRPYSNGISSAGRNVIFSLKAKFLH